MTDRDPDYGHDCGPACTCFAEISDDPTQRVEATTTPEGAKGWADQAGSAQVLAGGHGLNVAPDASPEGVRAETRRREQNGGGEPSNAPNAAFADTPIAVGVTRWGGRIHRAIAGDLYSPCGEHIRHRFERAPIETHSPLCEKCFTPEELHAVTLAWMERN